MTLLLLACAVTVSTCLCVGDGGAGLLSMAYERLTESRGLAAALQVFLVICCFY